MRKMDDVGLSVLRRLLFHGFRFWGFALFAFGQGINGLPKKISGLGESEEKPGV